MKLHWKKRDAGQIEFGIIFGTITLVLIGVGRLQSVSSLAPDCIFRELTGIPCLTCGSTRSVIHLSHGEIHSAFCMNPLTTLCLLSAILYFIYSLLSAACNLPRINIDFTPKERTIITTGVILLLLTQWTYLTIQL